MSQDESESSVGITWKFRQVELGRILSAYRKLRGEDRRLAESRMLSWLDAHKAEAGWDELRRIAPAGKLAKLESPGLADEILTLPNIEPLTCAYEIP
ncbi:MAG: hypothetical protein H8D67_03930, partial [Deltaproteobacteria bacterium]|nr:hypothetical protein [Deltaproteobacteria bacterium]